MDTLQDTPHSATLALPPGPLCRTPLSLAAELAAKAAAWDLAAGYGAALLPAVDAAALPRAPALRALLAFAAVALTPYDWTPKEIGAFAAEAAGGPGTVV